MTYNMKPNIEKLVEESGLYIAYDNKEVTLKEIEFFAELVAKRCSVIAMQLHNSSNFEEYDLQDEYNKGYDDACSAISGSILAEFGVKF